MTKNKKDKKSGLTEALFRIEKKFGKGAIMKLNGKIKEDVKAISTGSIELDKALGVGGVPRGRIIELYGQESSGKTTLALSIIRETQLNKGKAVFIDAEHSFDYDYAKKIGINLEELIISQPNSGEEALEIAQELITSGEIDLIVIDSVASLTPKAEIDGEMSDAQIGLQARLMSKACVDENEKIFLPEVGKYIKIKDIKKGDIVYSYKDNEIITQQVQAKYYRGKKPVYLLNNSIKLTGDHKILTIDGWKEVRNLTKKDVLIKKGKSNFGYININQNLAKIIGYLLGDGSTTHSWGVGTFTTINKEMVLDLKKLIAPYKCKLNRIDFYNYRIIKKSNLPKGSYKNPLSQALNKIKYNRTKCYFKKIPDIFFKANKKSIKALIEGLFNTDGYIGKQKLIGFASTSEILCMQVKELLNKFGIVGSITKKLTKSKFGQYWNFSITGRKNIELFYENFKLIKKHKNKLNKILRQYKSKACSRNDWLPSKFIPIIKKCFDNGAKVSKILGYTSRTSYPEWNKKGRLKLSKKDIKILLDLYPIKNKKYIVELKKLISDNIWYAPINSIIKQKQKIKVYDLAIKGIPNFIINDYILHNCRKLTGIINQTNTCVIFINQIREKIGIMFGNPEITPGGRALKFYSSVRIDLRRSATLKQGEKCIGTRVRAKIAKNKVAPPFKKAEFEIYFDEGVSKSADILNLAITYDIITQKGSWFSYKNENIAQGQENTRQYLKDNPKILAEIRNQILPLIGKED